MYSKYGLKLLHLALLPSILLGTNSIHFNPRSKTFYTTKLSRVTLFLVTTIIIFLTTFMCWRTLEIFLWKGGNQNEYFHICYAFSFAFVVCSTSLIFVNLTQNQICQGESRLVRYCIYFEGRWMQNYEPSKSLPGAGLDFLIVICSLFVFVVPWMSILHYFVFPQTPIFLTTLLPKELANHPHVYWGYAVFVSYYAFSLWQNLFVIGTLAMLFIFSTLPLLTREFRVGAKNQKSPESLRSPWDLCFQYRCMELIHTQLVGISGYGILMLHVTLGQFILFSTVTVILYKDVLENHVKVILIVWSLTAQIIWIFALEISGRFYEHATKTLRSWRKMRFRTRDEKAYMRKFLKGCRPLKIGVDGVFAIKRLTVLKFMRAVVKGTFRAVLTLGK